MEGEKQLGSVVVPEKLRGELTKAVRLTAEPYTPPECPHGFVARDFCITCHREDDPPVAQYYTPTRRERFIIAWRYRGSRLLCKLGRHRWMLYAVIPGGLEADDGIAVLRCDRTRHYRIGYAERFLKEWRVYVR